MARFYDGITCVGMPAILVADRARSVKVAWEPGLIWGPAGVGKSYRAAQMCDERTVWVNASRYVDDCRWAATVNLRESDDAEGWHALKRLEALPGRQDKMVIDDIGVDKPSEFTLRALYDLVDQRWSNMLPTVVTSNLSPEKLAELLGDRITSRIVGMGKVLHMDGPDRRVLGLRGLD